MSRRALLAALALVAAAPGPAAAKRDRNATGDTVKAARLLAAARYPEARALIADLTARLPTDDTVQWLGAELAFHDGRYADAVNALIDVPDATAGGLAGQTRRLAWQSFAVTSGFATKMSSGNHFELRYAPGPDEVIVDLAGDVLEAAYAAYAADLGWTPSAPVRVELLGAPSDLAKLSPLTEQEIETTGTIALSKYNKLMVVSPRATVFGYPWMDTLAHEYVHLVVTQLSHDEVPIWLQEGLARFEQARWRAAPGVVTLAAAERQLLATAARKGRLISLDEMHPSIAKLPSQEAAALAYAEVVTLVQWLHAKVGYAGLRDVIERQKDGKSARRAIADVVGTSFSKVEREWKASIPKGLDPVAGKAGKTRRIHFAKGAPKPADAPDGDETLGVDQVASGKARKHARLAGMMRARGLLDGAVVEYERAIAAGGSDAYLAGKLARTLLDLGKAERAAELAAPLVAADESDVVAAVTLGLARSAESKWAEAAAAFELALRVSPFDPAVRCGLAEAYSQTAHARADRERTACDTLSPTP
jgi:tetratricopeptide (TPR) repeat protein